MSVVIRERTQLFDGINVGPTRPFGFLSRSALLEIAYLVVSSMIHDLHFFMKGAIHLCFSCRHVTGDGLNELTLLGQIIFDQLSCNEMFPTQASSVSHSLRVA